MDADIQFGDVAEEKPRSMLRPDENPQFAVMACGEVREHDLRIYADLDAMLDMEEHALSNPEVELGGVMLGGHYIDQAGQPFVVVNDSLRAEHYESTRGSFKFTYDTWSHITRRLEAYPDEMRMVGWYHTHPDWGVFLSGMDLFICENFFNKPLDLALVIDPCRQDRGWFQWLPNRHKQPQRTGGFYLYSSRFRQEELAHYAQLLEGSATMPATLRSGASAPGGFGAPEVNVMSDRAPWLTIAVLGMLTMQSLFLLLLFWQQSQNSSSEAMQHWLEQERQRTELTVRRETLDQIVRQIADTKEGFVQDWERTTNQAKNAQTQLEIVTRSEQVNKETIKQQTEKIAALTRERDLQSKRLKEFEEKLASLEKKTREAQAASADTPAAGKVASLSNSVWTGLAVGGAVLVIGLGALWMQKVQLKHEQEQDDFPLASRALAPEPNVPASNDAPVNIGDETTNTKQGIS